VRRARPAARRHVGVAGGGSADGTLGAQPRPKLGAGPGRQGADHRAVALRLTDTGGASRTLRADASVRGPGRGRGVPQPAGRGGGAAGRGVAARAGAKGAPVGSPGRRPTARACEWYRRFLFWLGMVPPCASQRNMGTFGRIPGWQGRCQPSRVAGSNHRLKCPVLKGRDHRNGLTREPLAAILRVPRRGNACPGLT
jgi:hypothetical protein